MKYSSQIKENICTGTIYLRIIYMYQCWGWILITLECSELLTHYDTEDSSVNNLTYQSETYAFIVDRDFSYGVFINIGEGQQIINW